MKIPKLLKKKKREETKPEKIENIPLFFLRTFDSIAHMKISRYRRMLYYPATFIALYLVILIFARQIETVFTFPFVFSSKESITWIEQPSLLWEEVLVRWSYQNTIHGIFIDNKAPKTLFYFHGNGGSLPYFMDDISFFSSLWYNVMSFDYPGYWKSTGVPYENDVYKASNEFYQYIKKYKNLQDTDIVVIGYSIGTAPAVKFTGERNIDKLILFAPFSSRYDVAFSNYGWIPQKLFFLPNSFLIRSEIQAVQAPILYIHGNEDTIIPISQSKELYRKNQANAFYVELDNQGHNNIIDQHKDALSLIISAFIKNGKLAESFYFINKKAENLILEPQTFTGSTWSLHTGKKNIFEPMLEKMKPSEEQDILHASFQLPVWYVNHFDLDSDTSFTKYVNPYICYSNLSYIPAGLVSVESDFIYSNKWTSLLRPEAKKALENMGRDFYNTFWKNIWIASAYRSYEYQKGIKENGCSDAMCAHAGYSEHQSWLAVDLFEASTENDFLKKSNLKNYYWWLQKNAHKYGFHNSYQKGKKIDWYMKEPWHWRYVWIELATFLHDNNITFAEYYNALHTDKKQ